MSNSNKDVKKLIIEILTESSEIQEIIRNIAKYDENDMGNKGVGNSFDIDNLKWYKQLYENEKYKIEEYPQLCNKVKSLNLTINQNNDSIKRKDDEIKRLNESIDNLKQENEKIDLALKGANKTIEIIKKTFETPVRYLEMYRNLSNNVRIGLENVVSDKNEITFIASCTDEDNLLSIWEYIKDMSNDYNGEDFKKLNEIFDYFFDIYNQSLPEPKYERDDVEEGEVFDSDYHARCYGSVTSGVISEVILKGYRYKFGNKERIVRKSIVRI